MDQQDIATALSLETPSTRRGVDLAWLDRSHRAPRRFFSALHDVLGQVAHPGPKSAPDRGFDLYHDLVLRHVGAGRSALRFYDEHAPARRRWTVMSFDELHARASLRAAAWSSQGVEPGAIVAVVAPFEPECIISLLSGLRLGACVSFLEPGGPDYLGPRLAALAPQYIASAPFHVPLLGDLPALGAELLNDDEPGTRLHAGSHSYLAHERCALLFSPLRPAALQPVPILAEAAYFGALRDGAVSLALRPGDRLAAPGFATLQHQPALLFASLIMGATWVQITAKQVIADPNRLADVPLRSLGLTAPVREAFASAALESRPRWAHIFKNPEEPSDWEAWREFVELLDLHDTPMSNLLIDAASGGSLLASARQPGKVWLGACSQITAAAGRPWVLLDLTGSGQPAVGDVGVFAPLEGVNDEGDEGVASALRYVVMGRRRGIEYLYGGTIEPRRCGRLFPAQEITDTLGDCPFLPGGASIVAVPAGGATLEYRFVLVGFTGAESNERFTATAQRRINEISRVLATRLSVDHLPDRIELFACYARRRDGEVDHRWCREQYLAGLLYRKQRHPIFHSLTALRGALIRPAVS